MDTLGMISTVVRAWHKPGARSWQCASRRLYLSVVMVMSLSCCWCLMTPARAETAVVTPKGRKPTGFHHGRPPLLPSYRAARPRGPAVTFKRLTGRGCRKPRCAVKEVDGDAEPLVDDRPLRNVIVTGANRGLGFAIAGYMLDVGGYRVVLACRNQQEVRWQATLLGLPAGVGGPLCNS